MKSVYILDNITYKMHYIMGNCLKKCVYKAKLLTKVCILGENCPKLLINFREFLFFLRIHRLLWKCIQLNSKLEK